MPNPSSDPDWHQWRGEVSESHRQILRELKEIRTDFRVHENHDDRRFDEVNERHDKLQSKVTWFLGAASGISTAIGTGLGWFFSSSSGKQP